MRSNLASRHDLAVPGDVKILHWSNLREMTYLRLAPQVFP
jgi:hypothetical protein